MFSTAHYLLQQGVRGVLGGVLDVVMPIPCPKCETYLPRGSALGFCATCYGQLPWWNPSQLLPPKLGQSLSSFQAPLLYEEPLRQVLLDFKFHDRTHLAPLLAKMLYPYIPTLENAVLVPVPMHPRRLQTRTYNHAVLLVRELSKLTSIPCEVLALQRVKAGLPQHGQSAAARKRLTRSSFACSPVLAGKTVILVDDIFTTGSTLAACAGALKAAGAVAVHGRTLAYTPPR